MIKGRKVAPMSESDDRHHRQRVIPADPAQQRRNNSRVPLTQYEDKMVPCAGCGRRILWTAEQQRYWYEDVQASMYAGVNLRCDRCCKRGRHDLNRERARRNPKRRRDRNE
jgi:hypothetical protein